MKPRINWKRVWRKYDVIHPWKIWPTEKQTLQRLVNAELRGRKKGAKGK